MTYDNANSQDGDAATMELVDIRKASLDQPFPMPLTLPRRKSATVYEQKHGEIDRWLARNVTGTRGDEL